MQEDTKVMDENTDAFWSISQKELLEQVASSKDGLTGEDARRRLNLYGSNLIEAKRRTTTLTLLFNQFKSPIILILLLATVLSLIVHDKTDAIIILSIVMISSLLGFLQEKSAGSAVEKLLSSIKIIVTLLRDGKETSAPVEEVVPGDIVLLSAGGMVPADCRILESKDLFVSEATLTGETYPAEKTDSVLPPETPLNQRTNSLHMGTHIVSGSASAVVIRTGGETEFGKVSKRLKLKPPETEFQHGVRRFGYLLMEITLILVIGIFAVNVFLARSIMDSFLFSLALAVGLTPQLLPVIISINLSHGARRMAREKVIVKRLESIENFGSMNVLCSDKTGTLTEGTVRINSVIDAMGNESEKTLFYAYINSTYESGYINPIDEAVRTHRAFDITGIVKLDEVPYDFIRKRLSILVAKDGSYLMLTKGALPNVLDACSTVEAADGTLLDLTETKKKVYQRYESLSNEGYRVIGVACKDIGKKDLIKKEDETQMTLVGLITLYDPLKSGIKETLEDLRRIGVTLKVITGDNRFVAKHVGEQVGIRTANILTGPDLRRSSDEALIKKLNDIDLFAEIEPNQKERIILALKKTGNVVGYVGDGINDASALHAADVGISVESAVDVAKEAADIVLRERDLNVLVHGIQEGRKTFANTLKYVFMATSANFGNMFSMAGASLFLPFLPLLPKQILLANLMTDIPEMTIAADRVDPELIERPRRWNIRLIRNFMLTFGILSSAFDYMTFGVLRLLLHANQEQFRTGWFLESVVSATIIVLVIRTRKLFFKSRSHYSLALATGMIASFTLTLPYTPIAKMFGFQPVPPLFLLALGGIVLIYIIAAEATKKVFYKRVKNA
jgi:Mg2+-importing ATPase